MNKTMIKITMDMNDYLDKHNIDFHFVIINFNGLNKLVVLNNKERKHD